jgi:hypothetical protein
MTPGVLGPADVHGEVHRLVLASNLACFLNELQPLLMLMNDFGTEGLEAPQMKK